MISEKLLETERSKGFDDINIIREEAQKSGRHTFLDEWMVKEYIGQGSYGRVYKIIKPQQGLREQECALKVCPVNEHEDAEGKIQEIEAQMLLQGHPNAVQIEDYAMVFREKPNASYLLIRMEMLKALPKDGLDEQEVLRMGIDICSALEKCASCTPPLVHCDIKPENILMTADGCYKLSDFGTAKTLQSTMGHTVGKGTPLYMAPEVYSLDKGYDCRCDIYSLGFTMLTLLNRGVHPFADKKNAGSKKKFPTIKGVSDALMKVIKKMCEQSVQARYQSAAEVKNDLLLIVHRKWREINSELRKKERRFAVIAVLLVAFSAVFGGAALYAVGRMMEKTAEIAEVEPTPIESFVFSETDAGYVITEYRGSAENVIIPSEYNNRPITGIGARAFNASAEENAVLRTVVIPEGVQHLGDSCFMACSALERVEIPDSVTEIGSSAFAGCNSLVNAEIPETVTSLVSNTFQGCISLESVKLPDSLEYIGIGCFSKCSKLKEINIPEGVTFIGNDAFRDCLSLETISIPEGITGISNGTFNGCTMLHEVSLPDSVVSIDSEAFGGCKLLSTLILPESLEYIGSYAFKECEQIDVKIPGSVCYIGEGAFCDCTNLSEVTIPAAVREISAEAFRNCTSLASAEIENGVTIIEKGAFADCSALEMIILPGSVRSIGKEAFSCSGLRSAYLSEGLETIGVKAFYSSSLQKIYIPASVTTVAGGAFANIPVLESITVASRNQTFKSIDGVLYSKDNLKLIQYPNGKNEDRYQVFEGVESIGSYAFDHACTLESIELPQSIRVIGSYSFNHCEKLESAEVPGGVRIIMEHAFCDCYSLREVKLEEGIKSLGKFMFSGCTALSEIYIPGSITELNGSAFQGTVIRIIDVSEDNRTYLDEEGVLYTSDMNKLVAYPPCREGAEYAIPEGVSKIDMYAFMMFQNLKVLNIPESMMTIDKESFLLGNDIILNIHAPHEAEHYGYVVSEKIEWIVEKTSE